MRAMRAVKSDRRESAFFRPKVRLLRRTRFAERI